MAAADTERAGVTKSWIIDQLVEIAQTKATDIYVAAVARGKAHYRRVKTTLAQPSSNDNWVPTMMGHREALNSGDEVDPVGSHRHDHHWRAG
jgi:hypothetical protein